MKISKYYPITAALSINIILLTRFILTFQRDKEILMLEYGVCLVITVILFSIYFRREHRELKTAIFTEQMIASEMKSFWENLVASILGLATSAVQIYISISYYDSISLLKELKLEPQDHLIANNTFNILLHSYFIVIWFVNLIRVYFNHRELQHKKQQAILPPLQELRENK